MIQSAFNGCDFSGIGDDVCDANGRGERRVFASTAHRRRPSFFPIAHPPKQAGGSCPPPPAQHPSSVWVAGRDGGVAGTRNYIAQWILL